jgi:putative membrane protein
MRILSTLLMMTLATAAFAETAPTANAILEKLAQGGMTEVEAGKIAQSKGTAAGVQEFGEMMVKDHGASLEKVKSVASSKKLTLPDKPSPEQQESLIALRSKSGADFDQAYLAAQVKSHEETVAMLKSEIASGGDADIKTLAMELLPTVESHLREAYRLSRMEEQAVSATN